MKFCSVCERAATRSDSDSAPRFHCDVCKQQLMSSPEDSRVGGQTFETQRALQNYDTLLVNAPFDRVCKRVRVECKCGCDTMALARLGEDEVVVYLCSCGERILPELEHA